MNKILIVGSSGYIGSKLSLFLVMNGYEVVGLDKIEAQVQHVPTLIMDFKKLQKNDLKEYRHVILLAAHSSVADSKNDPLGTIENNILGLENLIAIMSQEQILYFASTASLYDGKREAEAEETDSLSSPRNIYDLSKRVGEDLINLSDKNSRIFRFGTVNGPSLKMRYDLVMNAMVRSAMRDRLIYLSNPYVHRAILSIDDLCDGVLNTIRTSNCNVKQEILNLVSFNTTIMNIANEVSKHFGVPIKEVPSGPTYDFSMSSKKAERIIEFKPKDSLIEIILKLERQIHESEKA